MRKQVAAAILMLSHLAYAGSGSSVVIAIGYSPQGPAARLTMLADYVAIPVNIQNDAKDPVKRSDEIEKAYRSITERLATQPGLKVMHGVISLSPRDYSKSLSSSASNPGSAQLYVLGAMKPDTNIFSLTKRIQEILAQTPLADGTKMYLGNTSLGLDEPEQYRSQLLGLIAKSVADTRKALGSTGFVEVEGLESSVTVMQWNDREVVLFINYRLRIQTKAT